MSSGVKINDATVTTADIATLNGTIHVIDKVLLPPAKDAAKSIVDIAVGDPQFSTLVAALTKAGLVDTLKGEGPFTVFAPTNDAFAKLLKDLDVTAEQLLAREDLKDILLYHVVAGKVISTDLTDGMMPKTVQGSTIEIDLTGGVMINTAKVTAADITASNGIIHVIDEVLIPTAVTTTLPDTGLFGIAPFLGLAALSGLTLVSLKKRK